MAEDDSETMLCVGGPFDGQTVTAPCYSETLIRDSTPEPGQPLALIRNTYIRVHPIAAGEPDVWHFQSMESLELGPLKRHAKKSMMTPDERELLRVLAYAVTTLIAGTTDRTGMGETQLQQIYGLIEKAGLYDGLIVDGVGSAASPRI